MNTDELPFSSIENEFLQIDYLTSLGPRIIGLYVKQANTQLFAKTPDAHWPTPHGEYYLHGGHRLWTAPEDPFYTCPEDHVHSTTTQNNVTLKSNMDASGLEKEIDITLDENCVRLIHRITWHGKEPIELAPWAITQLQLGGMAILPQSISETGLLPNRNFILWPYARLEDERLVLKDDLILLHGQPRDEAFKMGSFNPYGQVAYVLGKVLFVKRFPVIQSGTYPDMGCNAEVYVKDACVELETLGPLTILRPSDSVSFEETWEVVVGEYYPTIESARTIIQQFLHL